MLRDEFAAIQKKLHSGQPAALVRKLDGKIYRREFFPGQRLVLLGGGHVAQAICRFAAQLEFDVAAVVDDRPAFANTECFPTAGEILCMDFPAAVEKLRLCAGNYVCVVTRGHRHDADCLRTLLGGVFPAYAGMIGSRRRVRELFAMLAQEGYDAERLAQIHAPIGLPIAAITPEEIAISVCAQLIDCRNTGRDKCGRLEQTNTDHRVIDFLAQGQGGCAMALVVEAMGSTPVKTGAIMAMDTLGRCYGTIGGGCGEASVMMRLRGLLRRGGTDLMEVDMTNDVAAAEGMVCGGKMRVLLEAEKRAEEC